MVKESGIEEVQDVNQSFFSFRGRERRSAWWGAYLCISILVGIFGVFILMAIFGTWGALFASGLLNIVGLVSSLILLPVYVRRLHDCNISGWWMILHFGGLMAGPAICSVIGCIELIVVGCLDGTRGPNQYGPDPKGRTPPLAESVAAAVQAANMALPEERIEKLKALKDSGIITESEYEEKRAKLLAEI